MEARSSIVSSVVTTVRAAIDVSWRTRARELSWKANVALAAGMTGAAMACAVACTRTRALPVKRTALSAEKCGDPLQLVGNESDGVDPELWAKSVTTALAFRGLQLGVAVSRKEGASRRPIIMLFGDSITQFSFNPELCGWGAAVANWYARQADVLNRGFSGYNTRQGLILLRKLLPMPETDAVSQPRLLTIFFGANDAADAVLNKKQHVPVAEYETNLCGMIAHARTACPEILIVLITPPSLDEKAYAAHNLKLKRRKASDPLDRNVARIRPYVEAVCRVALTLDCAMVNLWDGAPQTPNTTSTTFLTIHCDGLTCAKAFRKLIVILPPQALIRLAPNQMISATDFT